MAFAATGQNVPVPAGGLGQRVVVIARLALLPARKMGGSQLAGQPPVPLRATGQDQQMRAGRVGVFGAGDVSRRYFAQRQLGAEHRRHLQFPGRLSEPHHPVQTVVVGECDRPQPQPGRLLDEFLRSAGTVEKAERRMGVQLGVGHRRPGRGEIGCGVPGALARPGRAVTAVGGRLGQWPTVEHPLHLGPGRRPVIPAHCPSL